MEAAISYLQTNVVILLFLVIGLGYLVGKLSVFGIGLGPTTGILIVGLILGLANFEIPGIVQGLTFTIYLFVLGTMVGPALVRVFTSPAAIQYLLMCLFVAVAAGLSVYFVSVLFGFNNVVAGGLTAGAVTTSAVLAAAQGSVLAGSVALPEGMGAAEAGNILASAYAITYLYGTFGLIVLIKICPMLVGKDIAEEAAKLEGGKAAPKKRIAPSVRAWRLTLPKYVGRPAGELLTNVIARREEGALPSLEQVLRNGKRLDITDDMKLEEGDILTFLAPSHLLKLGNETLGEEVSDDDALAIPMNSAEVVVTNADHVGKKLSELLQQHGFGISVDRIVRLGDEMPIDDEDLELFAGDVLFVSGSARRVEAFAQEAGYKVENQMTTDLMNMSFFLAAFAALGTITVTVAGVAIPPLGGSAMGAMFGGAFLGWLRTRSPAVGSVSAPAANALSDLGLSVFIAAVAIGAGGSLIATFQAFGFSLVLAGIIVTTFCTISTFLFGHFILRMNVAENAGATTGAMTGVAIAEVCKDAKSSAPAVAFGLPGAVSSLTFIVVGLIILAIVP
ncbi:TrkA C-terminal domain-containing protein [uncultured Roseibium sp.]|uniref:aspartate-alanine antiporter-like transporter n=1 Tax=uncultured Roseibium sp. TaxID=1936171 RepID=UPI0026396853|nr:TrkA C-terminal domain-containing protein [uncultured Roseibium sp.]